MKPDKEVKAKPGPFDIDKDGKVTPPHKWEEQFKGRAGPPPAEKLRERIRFLRRMCKDAVVGQTKSWKREIDWRMRQLEMQEEPGDMEIKEDQGGDAEHQK